MRKLANDLTGKRFGRLTVIGVEDNGKRKTYYACQCDCGNTAFVSVSNLRNGGTRIYITGVNSHTCVNIAVFFRQNKPYRKPQPQNEWNTAVCHLERVERQMQQS